MFLKYFYNLFFSWHCYQLFGSVEQKHLPSDTRFIYFQWVPGISIIESHFTHFLFLLEHKIRILSLILSYYLPKSDMIMVYKTNQLSLCTPFRPRTDFKSSSFSLSAEFFFLFRFLLKSFIQFLIHFDSGFL